MSLSIIIPTLGRWTLTNTILSLLPQMNPEDEIVVYADGILGVGRFLEDLDPRIKYHEMHPTHDSGNTQRDRAMAVARGSHFVFCDDDDIFVKTALDSCRRAVKADPDSAWMFRMKYGKKSQNPGLILWDRPEMEMCHVGTPMLLLPNKLPLPSWADCPKDQLAVSDYFFLDKVYRECYNSSVRWDSDILCLIRPDEDELKEELNYE